MGIFNRNQLRKRTFTATVTEAEVIKNFRYKGLPDVPAQAAIKLALKTTTGKETEQTWPIGDATNFKYVDDKTIRPKGDHAISENASGGHLVASLDKLKVELDDTVEPLEGMTFRWSQETVPGKKGTLLLPVELVGQEADEEDDGEEEDEDKAGDEESGEEGEDEESESEEEDEFEWNGRTKEGEEADDIEALATKAVVSLLKAKKKVSQSRLAIEVHKSAVLRSVSNVSRVNASKLAGTGKFQEAKDKPWAIKNGFIVEA